jgi:hypothetical protein
MWSHRTALLILALLAAGIAGTGVWYEHQRRNAERYLVFTVPPGSVARLASGEQLDILPQTIELSLRGRIRSSFATRMCSRSRWDRSKSTPVSSSSSVYYNPGVYELICTLHQSQRLRIVVSRE